jgi:DNA polymerase sigma
MKQLNRSHVHSAIEIDITVETHSELLKSNHLGINTTRRIKQWLQEFVALKPIILILKYYLSIHELNTTYKGTFKFYFRWN